MIRIDQPIDPNQIMTTNTQASESQQSYISGEVAYLSSPGFRAALQTELAEPTKTTFSVSQDSLSSIVTLSSTAPSVPQAERVINTALKLYGDHVTQQNRERGQAAVDALSAAIDSLRDQLRTAGEAAAAPPEYDESGNPLPRPVVPDMTGVPDRINVLENQRLFISVQMLRSPGVQVVQQPTETPPTGVPRWWLGAIGGGLLGGIAALSFSIIWRKRTDVITSMAAFEGEVASVVWPVVRLHKRGERAKVTKAEAGSARAVYAQLPAARGACFLIVGASADSGTSGMARLLSFAAAEHGLVETVRQRRAEEVLARPLSPRNRHSPTIVIDGGSLTNSSALPQAAATATHIIVVAMIGSDAYRQVRMVIQLARAHGVPVFAVGARRALFGGGRSRESKPIAITEQPQQPPRHAEIPAEEEHSADLESA
ncbi:Rossmann-fold NAD(P)-binding domain-containing protein [Mycolicibacterium anyangense]|jgi:hypothetical protein|nr:hypothetical protein [Mycolicibacterium anyangense]